MYADWKMYLTTTKNLKRLFSKINLLCDNMEMSQADKKTLEEMMAELPPEVLQEITDFASFLWHQYAPQKKSSPRKLKLDWKGGLSDLKDQFTSVELQHKALEWWDEDVSS